MTAGVGTDIRIPVPDIEALLDVAEYDGRYATIEIEIADDGIADRVEADGTEVHASGVTGYRFFVIHDSGGTPTPIHVVNVGPDRSAPGWDRRITPAERDVYLAPAPGPLEVALPLMAHELLEMRTDGPMVSFSASDALDDFEGIAWQSGGAGAPIGDPHAPTAPFSRVFTATDVGFVPGQLYEIDLTGRERGLATDLIAVQSQTGGFLEPWADAALAGDDELRKHDSRFVFRVYPIRIERPNQTVIRGRTSVGLPAGPAPMPATVAVPLELLSPRAALGEAVFVDAHVRLAGALIGTLHTPFTHPASPSVLSRTRSTTSTRTWYLSRPRPRRCPRPTRSSSISR